MPAGLPSSNTSLSYPATPVCTGSCTKQMSHQAISCRDNIRLLQVREKDWCNVITAHHGDTAAYTWRLQNFTLGQNVLRPPVSKKRKADSYPEAPVTAVAMSQCGNYGLVGRANGSLDRYNMQSGLHRGSYVRYCSIP